MQRGVHRGQFSRVQVLTDHLSGSMLGRSAAVHVTPSSVTAERQRARREVQQAEVARVYALDPPQVVALDVGWRQRAALALGRLRAVAQKPVPERQPTGRHRDVEVPRERRVIQYQMARASSVGRPDEA